MLGELCHFIHTQFFSAYTQTLSSTRCHRRTPALKQEKHGQPAAKTNTVAWALASNNTVQDSVMIYSWSPSNYVT